MKTTTSWPSFASAFGSEPQTSPRPPVFAIGETSAVAKRMRMRRLLYRDARVPHDAAVIAVHIARRCVFDEARTGRAELLRGDEHRRRRDEAAHRAVFLFD